MQAYEQAQAGPVPSTSSAGYGLTRMQRQCLRFIKAYVAENEYPPSYQEIMEGVGLHSKSGIHRLVKGLELKGHVRLLPNRARSIQVIDDANVITLALPAELDHRVRLVAAPLNQSPEKYIIDVLTRHYQFAAVQMPRIDTSDRPF